MLVTEKAQWIYLAKVRLTQLVEAYKLRAASVLIVCIECLETASTTEAQAEKILTYIVQEYCLDEVPVPIIIPNIPYLPVPTYGAGKDGRGIIDADIIDRDLILTYDQFPFSQNVGQVVPDVPASTFPIGTPNVNVAVGGWFVGYVLAGKEVIASLIDLGVQFINPSTSISIQSITQSTSGFIVSGTNVERGIRITAIAINRTRTLGSATFIDGSYTQPNIGAVPDNPSGAVAPFNLTPNNLFVGNITSGTNPPTYTINLLSRYSRTPTGPIDPALNDNDQLVITFVSPVYFGVLAFANTTNAASIQALTKASLANSRARSNLSFTPTALEGRLVYAYPTRLSGLTNILFDGFSANQLVNFNTPPTVVSMSFGINAPNEDYNVYVYSTDVSPSTIIASFS
jgi:hypothetical protein